MVRNILACYVSREIAKSAVAMHCVGVADGQNESILLTQHTEPNPTFTAAWRNIDLPDACVWMRNPGSWVNKRCLSNFETWPRVDRMALDYTKPAPPHDEIKAALTYFKPAALNEKYAEHFFVTKNLPSGSWSHRGSTCYLRQCLCCSGDEMGEVERRLRLRPCAHSSLLRTSRNKIDQGMAFLLSLDVCQTVSQIAVTLVWFYTSYKRVNLKAGVTLGFSRSSMALHHCKITLNRTTRHEITTTYESFVLKEVSVWI